MKTSQKWWDEVKQDPVKFNDWLQKQYRGEVTAAYRIREVAKNFSAKNARILETIAGQEEMHAEWVKGLLEARGIQVKNDTENAEKRYWAVVKQSIKDYSTAMAVAAHAEGMRLERIRAIAYDSESPEDVRSVFSKILNDELFHERAFRTLAGSAAMEQTAPSHEEGRRLLGLEA